MTMDQLTQALSEREVTLCIQDGSLRFRAPLGALKPELRAAIAEHRSSLIERLRAKTDNGNRVEVPECTFCDRKHWIDERPKGNRIRTTCGKCDRFMGYRTCYRFPRHRLLALVVEN